MQLLKFFTLFLFIGSVFSDIYMHNPRGSNDRLNEDNTNRNNAQRLFDSQNNAKGGYCRGDRNMPYYYEGSLLHVEWTSQHACGNPNVHCNYVLQYMCTSIGDIDQKILRDGSGSTTDTIPTDQTQAYVKESDDDFRYGMHEPYSNYQACQTRRRNGGLYIADRAIIGGLNTNPNNNAATQTRQNNGGTRHGYECPEERDYYPYWHPSPWKDIAVLVDAQDSSRCSFYRSESQNRKSKNECRNKDGSFAQANNEADCKTGGAEWLTVESWGISAPDCIVNQNARDNHLGNVGIDGAHTASYNWTIPDNEDCVKNDSCSCALRLRYNISSEVQFNWDYTLNGQASPIKEDPDVPVEGAPLTLAVDTTQFGRTFQDRSHAFAIKKKPASVTASKIHNLNVRGKRGNIVQTYPAVEYDFVPTILYAMVGDYVHIQFKGCDNNPAGNAGEGTAKTDRSNMVQMEDIAHNYPASKEWMNNNANLFSGMFLQNRMALVGQDVATCAAIGDIINDNQNALNCQKLNHGPSYFDAGLIRFNNTSPNAGSTPFYYMSTRNNNFTNRSQKGHIFVQNALPIWGIVLVVVGSVVFALSGLAAGGFFYSRTHPHSQIAQLLNRF